VMGRSTLFKSFALWGFWIRETAYVLLDIGEAIYTNAECFIPERWYSKPDMVKENTAFSPFATGMSASSRRQLLKPISKGHKRLASEGANRVSAVSLGPYGCIGKPLALMQMRTLVARIITDFDVGFAPGEDGTNLVERSRDHFTLGLADLNLVFRRR